MTELFLRSVFADNLILSFFLGVCTFVAVSRRVDTAVGLGVAMVVVQTITVPLNQLIHGGLLVAGAWAWLGLRGGVDNACRKLNIAQLVVALPGILVGGTAFAWYLGQG